MTTRDYSGIAEMSVSGGEPQKMPNLLPLKMTVLSLSPDGSSCWKWSVKAMPTMARCLACPS